MLYITLHVLIRQKLAYSYAHLLNFISVTEEKTSL